MDQPHRHWQNAQRKKKLDGNCTEMLRAIFNKSLKQHPTK